MRNIFKKFGRKDKNPVEPPLGGYRLAKYLGCLRVKILETKKSKDPDFGGFVKVCLKSVDQISRKKDKPSLNIRICAAAILINII